MTEPTQACRFARLTGAAPGAIAIVLLEGDVLPVLTALTGRADWPIGRVRLVEFGEFDEGLAGRLDERTAELMPHGGPRVMQRLAQRLTALGVEPAAPGDIDPLALHPEARDRCEALMLSALARAASPLAIDLLLDQPRRWRAAGVHEAAPDVSARLNRLIDPPLVVVAGPPNVGKSTLSNALLGRWMSIALDHPGTTRDYTAGLIDLNGLVVVWHDTPGLHAAHDPIEHKAIELARSLAAHAALVISLTDRSHDWPPLPQRPADLLVASKGDLDDLGDMGVRNDADLVIAHAGAGLADLAREVRDLLVPPDDLATPDAWRFDPRL